MKTPVLLFAFLAALPVYAEDVDLEALWHDACLWEVGSNLQKVPEARKKLIEQGERTIDFLVPGKLDAADTIITRAQSMVITGIAGAKDCVPRLREKTVQLLVAGLASDKPNIRRNCADLLGQLGAKEAADKIAALLADKDARGGALSALGALKVESSVPQIAKMAADESAPERARYTALATLGAIGGAEAQTALLTFLSDASAPVRFAAQYALEAMRSTGALAGKLKDPDRRVRLHAISALGRLMDRATRADLKPLLDDPDATVRGFTVEALSAMSMPSDRARIESMLVTERDPFVRGKLEAALHALE